MCAMASLRRVVLTEVSSLLSLVRVDAQWVSQSGSKEALAALDGLKRLHRLLLGRVGDWTSATPREVLAPLFAAVQCETASSPFTGAALETLHRVVVLRLLCDGSDGANEALEGVVSAFTQCRFEATDTESDELVIGSVFQLMQSTLQHAGTLLSNTAVGSIVQACFSLNQPGLSLSDVLRGAAEQAFLHVVHAVFAMLPAMLADEDTANAAAAAAAAADTGASTAAQPPPAPPGGSRGVRAGVPCVCSLLKLLCSAALRPLEADVDNDATTHPANSHTLCFRALSLAMAQTSGTVARCAPLMALLRDDLCAALLHVLQYGAARGLGAAVPVPKGGVGAAAFAGHTFDVLATALELVRTLWGSAALRWRLAVQLETLFNAVFLRAMRQAPTALADGGAAFAEWGAIVECVEGIFSEPGALVDLYIIFDCDVALSDVLENTFKALSAILTARPQRAANAKPQPRVVVEREAAVRLQMKEAAMNCVLAGLRGMAHRSASHHPSVNGLSAFDLSRMKFKKRALCQGALLFNEKPRKGFMELQRLEVLPSPLEPAVAAELLHALPPGMKKEAVGAYLGELGVTEDKVTASTYVGDTAAFHSKLLAKYVGAFDFGKLSLLQSLRAFLSSFRLPGEAQQIDRILVAFADKAYQQCDEHAILATSDVAYVLSFSIIMLQTDLHNKHIKEENRMKFDDFYKNNKNYGEEVSRGQDLPKDYLWAIYESVRDSPFEMQGAASSSVSRDAWRDMLRCSDAVQRASCSLVASHEHGSGEPAISETVAFSPQVFAVLWSPTLAALSTCLLPSGTTSHRVKAVALAPAIRHCFLVCAGLSSRFSLGGVLDQIIISLCNFSQLLSPIKSLPAAPEWEVPAGPKTFGAFCTPSAHLSCQLMVEIVHQHGNDIRDGWKPVLACLLRLFELRLLPEELQGGSNTHFLPPSEREQLHECIRRAALEREANEAGDEHSEGVEDKEEAAQSSGGLIGWFFGGADESAATDESKEDNTDDDDDEDGEDDEELDGRAVGAGDGSAMPIASDMRESIHKMLRKASIVDFIGDSKFHDEATLAIIIKLLIAAAEPSAWTGALATNKDDSSVGTAHADATKQLGVEEWSVVPGGGWPPLPLPSLTAASCGLSERLLTEFIICNRFRVLAVWPLLHSHYECNIAKVDAATFVTEEAISGMLRLLVRLWSREALSGPLSESMYLLPDLDASTWNVMAPLIVCGVSQLVQAHSNILGDRAWECIFKIVSRSARNTASYRHGLQLLRCTVNDPGLDVQKPALCCEALQEFVSCEAQGVDQSFVALKLLWGLQSRILLGLSSQGGPSAFAPACLVVLRSISICCRDRRAPVRKRAVLLLQCVLVDKRADELNSAEWQRIFDTIFFPLMDALAEQRETREGHASGDTDGCNFEIELVGDVFCQRLHYLLTLPRFHDLWQAFLHVLEKFASLEAQATSPCVAAVQFGKAMERMRQLGAFQPGNDTVGREVEDLTWAIVDEMRADVASEFHREANASV